MASATDRTLPETARRSALSWRGPGPGRPDLPLPPRQLPLMHRGILRKRWRYVGFYGDEVMLCLATVLIGPARHCFWSLWDRESGRVLGHTQLRPGTPEVAMEGSRVELHARDPEGGGPVRASLTLGEVEAVEVVRPSGRGWGWTRKRAGVPVTGRIEAAGRVWQVDGFGMDDESAGFHTRHTAWLWSAGFGMSTDGRHVAWNLVSGINDPDTGSERAIWIEGKPYEPGPVLFHDLDRITFPRPSGRAGEPTGAERAEAGGPGSGGPGSPAEAASSAPVLDFEFRDGAERVRQDNFLLVRSDYIHRFGTFSGSLDGIELESGLGVMEEHRAVW